MLQELKVDESRLNDRLRFQACDIVIMAMYPDGKIAQADVAVLDKASLLKWLRSRGGENKLAENVVGVVLGHGPLHDD